MPKWFLLHYIMEEKGTSQVQGRTKWLSESFQNNLQVRLKSFFQLYPFYSLWFHLLYRQPLNSKCVVSFEL